MFCGDLTPCSLWGPGVRNPAVIPFLPCGAFVCFHLTGYVGGCLSLVSSHLEEGGCSLSTECGLLSSPQGAL